MARPGYDRKTSTFAVAFSLPLAVLTGCSGSDTASTEAGGKVALTFAWWGNEDRAQRTKKAVDLFETRHPGVTVRTSFAGYEAYVQKLANFVLETIQSFQVFTSAFAMSGGKGGPADSTMFYTLYLYERGFSAPHMGYASAMAWVLPLAISAVTFVLFKTSRSWVLYANEGV
ncbi:ABC transporter permease [Streptomyces hygroscopicus]|nr:ABC transporter permease [Streptomyces hygroscopicus]